MFNNQIIAGAAGQGGGSFYGTTIDQSLRFNDGDSAHLNFTPSSAGDQKTWTWSAWIKRGTLGTKQNIFNPTRGGDATNESQMDFTANDQFQIYDSGATRGNKVTTRKFRDPSAWYHIVVALDIDNATAADRVKIYVNGEREESFATNVNPGTSNWGWNAAHEHSLGSYNYGADGSFFDGYMAEVHFIDGTALDPTSFGETSNGVWIPKSYSGSYGTNGWYLSFADSAAIGDDLSGNTNDWTANNLAATDVLPDSPTNNFCTWNEIGRMFGTANVANMSEGSLKATTAGNSSHIISTFGIEPADTQGYYWEVKAISLDSSRSYLGIIAPEGGSGSASGASYAFYYKGVLNMNGNYYGNNDTSSTNVVSQTSWTTNDILMFAYKDGKFWIGKNGTWMNSGNPAAGTGDLVAQDGGRPSDRGDVTWFPYAGYNSTYTANFGQDGTFAGTETAGGNSDENGYGNFKYSVPSGFLAMCSANLPEPSIGPNSNTTSEEHFNTVLWSGNSTNNRSITTDHATDFVWIKKRGTTVQSHVLADSVRGTSDNGGTGNNGILDISTAIESTNSSDSGIASFDSTGFTIGAGSNTANADAPYQGTNASSHTYVGWSWKAGGSSNTFNIDGTGYATAAAASLDGGDISPTGASINTTNGLSILTYTGNGSTNQTIKHGLSQAPQLTIVKDRDSNSNNNQWWASSTIVGDDYLYFSGTAAATGTAITYPTTGDNTTLTIQRNTPVANNNESGDRFVMYNFHSVEGFSKVGTYYGNTTGYSNGVFVYTGFRPAFLMTRAYGTNSAWVITDNERNSNFNNDMKRLYANTTAVEGSFDTNVHVEFYSNGFSVHATTASSNENRINQQAFYVYLAYAEAPFKYANAR